MNDGRVYNLLFAGVGGQGALLAAEVTALCRVPFGFDGRSAGSAAPARRN